LKSIHDSSRPRKSGSSGTAFFFGLFAFVFAPDFAARFEVCVATVLAGAAGKASLLVPFALAADDHQRRNAEVFRDAGAATMLTEAEIADPEKLLDELGVLLGDRVTLLAMGERARTLAHTDAVREIADIVVALA
jgi:hypothetical protein